MNSRVRFGQGLTAKMLKISVYYTTSGSTAFSNIHQQAPPGPADASAENLERPDDMDLTQAVTPERVQCGSQTV
jgi:hypothetical protein